MRRTDEDDYRQYVVANMQRLRRAAYVLCRDWHTADDLVSITIGKLYRHWARAQRASSLDAYARTTLVRSWLDEQRRPWRREQVTDDPSEFSDRGGANGRHGVNGRDGPDVADRLALLDLLAALTPRRRAAVFLRFYFDLSVDQTAEILGCSPGTVRSMTARALEAMRARAALSEREADEEAIL